MHLHISIQNREENGRCPTPWSTENSSRCTESPVDLDDLGDDDAVSLTSSESRKDKSMFTCY